MKTLILMLVGAAAVAWLLTGRLRIWAPRLGLIDAPDNRRKTHKAPVPLGGAGYWWPAAFAYTDPSYALTAVAGVVGATLVVWLGLLGLARASPT